MAVISHHMARLEHRRPLALLIERHHMHGHLERFSLTPEIERQRESLTPDIEIIIRRSLSPERERTPLSPERISLTPDAERTRRAIGSLSPRVMNGVEQDRQVAPITPRITHLVIEPLKKLADSAKSLTAEQAVRQQSIRLEKYSKKLN